MRVVGLRVVIEGTIIIIIAMANRTITTQLLLENKDKNQWQEQFTSTLMTPVCQKTGHRIVVRATKAT